MTIGYYIDNSGLYSSSGFVFKAEDNNGTTKDKIFQWMLTDNPKENKLFYDLDACVASLIHMTLSEEQAQELYMTEKVKTGFYKLTYFPKRFFSIDGYRRYANFGNALRYKSDTHYSPDETIEDKITKAKEAALMAKNAGEVLKEINLDSSKIISPITALIEKYIKPLALPTVDNYPEEVGEIAYQSIKGNWNECYQLGHWDKASDIDINGAYASRLARLLDIRRGTWEESDTIPDKAIYGFADGQLDIYADTLFHPYMVKINEEFSYTPTGSNNDLLSDGIHQYPLLM